MLISIPGHIGYPLLALLVGVESAGVPVPGETALIAAGGLASAGQLSLPIVIAVAAVAAVVGDTVGYLIGRRFGRSVPVRGRFLVEHRRKGLERADRFFARHGVLTVFFGRWVPGVRVAAAVMAGASGMPWSRFAPANALGALVWAAGVAGLAHQLGAAGAALLSAFGLTLGASVLLWQRLRRSGRETEATPAAV